MLTNPPMNPVEQRRIDLGWTQTDLARKSGISLNTIRSIEGNADLSDLRGPTAKGLADAFEMTPSALVAEVRAAAKARLAA